MRPLRTADIQLIQFQIEIDSPLAHLRVELVHRQIVLLRPLLQRHKLGEILIGDLQKGIRFFVLSIPAQFHDTLVCVVYHLVTGVLDGNAVCHSGGGYAVHLSGTNAALISARRRRQRLIVFVSGLVKINLVKDRLRLLFRGFQILCRLIDGLFRGAVNLLPDPMPFS